MENQFAEKLITLQVDAIKYKTEKLLQGAENDPHKLSEALNSIVEMLTCIEDDIKRKFYINELQKNKIIKQHLKLEKSVKAAIADKSKKIKKDDLNSTLTKSKT